MLDQAKSSAIPRRTLARATPQPPEGDPTPLPEGLSRSATDDPLYSIRVAEKPGTLCAAGRKEQTGSGPGRSALWCHPLRPPLPPKIVL